MKKILFLASKGGINSNLEKITPQLQTELGKKFQVHSDTYSNLEYAIIDQKASIYSSKNKMDIKDYDLVAPITWQRTPEQVTACIIYLRHHKTKMILSDFINIRSHAKLTENFIFWDKSLPIPNTIYSKNLNIIKMLKREHLKFPIIAKEAFKHKGNDNYLTHEIDNIRQIVKKRKGKRFIFQEFIPNDYDYRIVTFGYKPKLVIKRARHQDSGTHLNNTSHGAIATQVPLNKIDPKILTDVTSACKAMKREIAGADVLVDSETGKHYFLEINYAPQLRTGTFADNKMKEYTKFLKEKSR